jgi:hypothetical protein
VISKIWRCTCKAECRYVIYRQGERDKYFLDESYIRSQDTDVLHDVALMALWDAVGEGGV